jgi:uncharacterized protein DUF4157
MSKAAPAGDKATSPPARAAAAAAPLASTAFAAAASRRLGNQYLHSLLYSGVLQAKLAVSQPGDELEREADHVADQVMRATTPGSVGARDIVQRRIADVPSAQRASDAPDDTSSSFAPLRMTGDAPSVDANTESAIAGLPGRGSALPQPVRSFMESRFHADFRAVRVHTDAGAHALARAVNAQAFTVGPHVVFGAGHYSPESESGRRLLAHELTHVVQQGAASPGGGDAHAVQRQVDYEFERQSPLLSPTERRRSLDAHWYVEMDPATPIVAAGTEVVFRLKNSEGAAIWRWEELDEGTGHAPVFILSDEHGHHKAFKTRSGAARVTLGSAGKYRATMLGRPIAEVGPPGPDRAKETQHGDEVRVSVDIDVVGDVSPKTVGSATVRATAARDLLHLEDPETSDGEIAAAFERLAVRRAFEVLEANRKEALEQLALYTAGDEKKTGLKATEELASVFEVDKVLKREEARLLNDKERLLENAKKAGRSPPEYQQEQLQRVAALRGALVVAFPALALINRDADSKWTFDNHPELRGTVIQSGLRQVLADIEKAKQQLATGDLSILRVEPILADTRKALGIDGDPRASRAVDRIVKAAESREAKLGMAVGAASVILLFVPGIGPYLAASVGIAWATRSWIRVGDIRAAAGAGVREGIVDRADVVTGTFWAVLDTVFAALDLGAAAKEVIAAARGVAPHVPEAAARITGRSARELREAEAAAGVRPRLDGAAKAEQRVVMSESELRERAADVFRRPISDMTGQIHFYATEEEFQAEFARQFPNFAPTKSSGYFVDSSGHIFLSPRASLKTIIHEVAHKVFDETLPMGHELIGAFLEEGIVETITRARVGPRGVRTSYETHVNFVALLQKRLGSGVVDDLVVHGDYRSFREAVKRMFLGSEEKTFTFLNTLRRVDGGAENALGNPDALEEAIHMLQDADRAAIPHSPAPVHPRETRPTVVQTPEQRAKLIEASKKTPDVPPRSPAPRHPAPPGRQPHTGHPGAPKEGERPRLGPDDFDDETPTPVDKPKPRKKRDEWDEDTVVRHQDTSVDAGEINAPDHPTSKGKVTSDPPVIITDSQMLERARRTLAAKFMALFHSGGMSHIMVERVGFGNVEVFLSKERDLVVLRDSIINADRIRGQGSAMHSAFEQAAIDTARAVGAKRVRVAMSKLQNQDWVKELRRLGYEFDTIATKTGFTRAMVRTITL